ncbi:MAG: sodium/proton-translocating pyrophosphatase [Armatimonadetes bacterium]|nr:sodium/proton-translocating pyrophosphatase [Armatimonadota bacterium]
MTARTWTKRASGLMKVMLVSLISLLMPAFAAAAGGEADVRLEFSSQDRIFLFVSLAIGALAIIVALLLMGSLNKESTGGEKMEEVGGAIFDGAMAYLKRQISTMVIFVIIIAALLVGMYYNTYGLTLSLAVAGCFVAGVAASYIAGFSGMRMAVKANMRTAAASLVSAGKPLDIAFRSGGVAGLFTVGMGLIGATLIFLIAQAEAMKLLVGFGFGGSLAALFMRVGGGIYTKAADVGADLVGKVEAGIPEDDPRNPAVIADNVGDNVGDCAGMAADVFESYEVTLVAAIVLGAATSVMFDQSTWMKLILFALLARGVGIIASILGIFMVRGSNDVDADALKPISAGFLRSAAIAAVLTGVLAFFMMGGQKGQLIQAAKLKSQAEANLEMWDTVKAAQKKAAAALAKKSVDQLKKEDLDKIKTVADLKTVIDADPKLKALGLTDQDREMMVNSVLTQPEEQRPEVRDDAKLAGYSVLDPNDTKNPAMAYTVAIPPQSGEAEPEYMSLGDYMKKFADPATAPKVYKVMVTQGQASGPTAPKATPYYLGPTDLKTIEGVIENAKKSNPGLKVEITKETFPAKLMASREGKLAWGIGDGFDVSKGLGLGVQSFFKAPVAEVKKYTEDMRANKQGATPPAQDRIQTGALTMITAEWWRFLLCIVIGIVMAYAFERMTDYYVSTHRRPVQEIANVASAGPAPMIIQGFSYGLESSAFSVLAIVVALLAPLYVFPAAEFGGYLLSFYGIALVGLGLLTTTGYILAMDTFGPISDNAQGVFEMSGAGEGNPEASKVVQRLDAAGNTTKALTKGFAIATAVVAAVALFHSYVEQAMLTSAGLRLEVPEIFLGLLIGGAAPFVFSAFSINAVGRAAFALINEVRRQFREDAGIMAGTSKPDYGRCVSIVTAAAQNELLSPGILAIFLPVAVAFGFSIGKDPVSIGGHMYNLTGAQALGGFLAGTILSGQLMAVLLANSGGMWDNAKKLIEDGLHGGKGTEAHKAGVVCDTVGDPFKDTAGPALNPLIKVMNLVALLLAPTIIQPMDNTVRIIITAVSILFLIFSVLKSKKGSMSDALTSASNE